MSIVPKQHRLQRQLRRLLFILALLTGLNAFFFWKSLDNLFEANGKVSRAYKLISWSGDLDRALSDENKIRDGNDKHKKENLANLRTEIKFLFKQIGQLASGKDDTKFIHQLQKQWTSSHDDTDTRQLLILLRSFVKNEQRLLEPLESKAADASKATISIIVVYVVVFGFAILFLSQYLTGRVFQPLHRLSDKIKNFQAGQYELPTRALDDNEIGQIESQFYYMAGRVGETVTELKELDRVKTDFISIASHELRTPMTSVKGSLSLILTEALSKISPEVKEVLTIAEKETDRLIRLINDILDLTKMETKKLSLDKKRTSIGEIVEAAVAGLSGLYEVTKVTVKIDPKSPNVSALVDRDRIQQVITNLLSNAVKFSPAGSTVIVGYEVDGTNAVVSVKDKGPGIKQEDHAHVFDKFRSMDAGKSKIIRGTGLGLPICKAIIEQHGGQIGLHSRVGSGSTFFFTLPDASQSGKVKAAA